jgi:ABC-2 type transport system ATP-binding protein
VRRAVLTILSLALVAGLPAVGLGATSSASAADPYTVTPLWFRVTVGAQGDQQCTIVADQYLPRTASRTKPVPAILTTNGFGGSKDDQAGLARLFASRGYAVITYSGLGFGGSGCRISLDDPAVDGKAASQLISYLGGATGTAFLDAGLTRKAPALTVVRRDAKDHAGRASAHDPRVGMVGVSYGGGVQLATASIDPRLDTIVPGATWNDLSYSLAPNNTSQTGVSSATPGAAKLVWALGFVGKGALDGFQKVQQDPSRVVGCPNFVTFVCPSAVTAAATGTIDPGTVQELRSRSAASFVSKVRVPTLLLQGQTDTLFNLNEATATFQALRARKVPTKLVWINGGHSGPNAPGEVDFAAPSVGGQYLVGRISAWFDHYLKGAATDTGPLFSYFRDWVSYTGNARPAYATSATFPVGTRTPFYLSGTSLTRTKASIAAGSQTLLTGPVGAPTSLDPIDVVGSQVPVTLPEADLPGTTASWTTPTLTSPLTVVGAPTLDLAIGAPTAALTQALDAGKVVVFVKVLDVGPDGKGAVVRDLVAPVRVPDAGKPFRVTLPAFAHRFEKGHSLRLVVAGGSVNYRGGLVPAPVTIATGSASQVLSLPLV